MKHGEFKKNKGGGGEGGTEKGREGWGIQWDMRRGVQGETWQCYGWRRGEGNEERQGRVGDTRKYYKQKKEGGSERGTGAREERKEGRKSRKDGNNREVREEGVKTKERIRKGKQRRDGE